MSAASEMKALQLLERVAVALERIADNQEKVVGETVDEELTTVSFVRVVTGRHDEE